MVSGESCCVFNRSCLSNSSPLSQPSSTSSPKAGTLLSEEFSCIIVDPLDHPSPPDELWICDNLPYIASNVQHPLPLFMGTRKKAKLFKFIGCYRIVRWVAHPTNSPALDAFMAWRRNSRPEPECSWEKIGRSQVWVQVFLEKVINPILTGSAGHKYVIRYALHIMKKRDRNPQSNYSCNQAIA